MKKDFLNMDLSGKTVVFTGGTDGMGKEAVKKIAKMGATIMLFGRSKEKTLAVAKELNEIAKRDNTTVVQCDLSSQESIRKAAQKVLDTCPKIDYVINCAGANFGERKMTSDGHEMTWAVNHLERFRTKGALNITRKHGRRIRLHLCKLKKQELRALKTFSNTPIRSQLFPPLEGPFFSF